MLLSIASAISRANRRRRMLEEQRRRELERRRSGGAPSPFEGMPFGGLLEAMMGGAGGWTRTLEYDERTGRWVEVQEQPSTIGGASSRCGSSKRPIACARSSRARRHAGASSTAAARQSSANSSAQERVGAAAAARARPGSRSAACRPNDPREARVCAQPSATRAARGVAAIDRPCRRIPADSAMSQRSSEQDDQDDNRDHEGGNGDRTSIHGAVS